MRAHTSRVGAYLVKMLKMPFPFAEALLDYMYVFSAQFAEFRDRRQKRSLEAQLETQATDDDDDPAD